MDKPHKPHKQEIEQQQTSSPIGHFNDYTKHVFQLADKQENELARLFDINHQIASAKKQKEYIQQTTPKKGILSIRIEEKGVFDEQEQERKLKNDEQEQERKINNDEQERERKPNNGELEMLRSNPTFQPFEKAMDQIRSSDLPEDWKKALSDLLEKMGPYLKDRGIETFGPLFQQYAKAAEAVFSLMHDKHHPWDELKNETIHDLIHKSEHQVIHQGLHKGTDLVFEHASKHIKDMLEKSPEARKDAIKSLLVVSLIVKGINSMAEYAAKARDATTEYATKAKDATEKIYESVKPSKEILSMVQDLTKIARESLSDGKTSLSKNLQPIIADLFELYRNMNQISADLSEGSKVEDVELSKKNENIEKGQGQSLFDGSESKSLAHQDVLQSSFGVPPVPGASWIEGMEMQRQNLDKMRKLAEEYQTRKNMLMQQQLWKRQGASLQVRGLIGSESLQRTMFNRSWQTEGSISQNFGARTNELAERRLAERRGGTIQARALLTSVRALELALRRIKL